MTNSEAMMVDPSLWKRLHLAEKEYEYRASLRAIRRPPVDRETKREWLKEEQAYDAAMVAREEARTEIVRAVQAIGMKEKSHD